MAGLLTYFRYSCLPIFDLNSDDDWNTNMKLTAAGQLRIYTIFPFNPYILIYKEPKAMQMYQISYI